MKYYFLPLLFLLSGCFPHCYRGRPLNLECTDLAPQVQEGFESGSVCKGEYPDEKWWTFFQDPQLDCLIELSLANHPDIKIAEARIMMAQEEALEARSRFLPHFFLFGDLTREKLSKFGSRTQGTATLQYITEATTLLSSASYELDIWKKNRNTYDATIDEMIAQVADFDQARLVLSTTIASVYFDLQYNLDLLRIVNERLKAREELYALLLQRFNNGVIAQFELYETDTEVQMIRDQAFQLEGFIGIDRHALAALIGNAACTDLVVEPAAVFETPLPLPCSLSIDLLARRPDINAQRWRVQASSLMVKVAKAQFFPEIDLLGYVGFGSFKLAEMFKKPTLTWVAEAVGKLPIFTAGKLDAQLGISRETLEIAVETYNQLVLNAVQEVSDALTGLKTADRRIDALQKAITDSKSLYALTYDRFVNNIDDRIAVLNAVENVLVQEELETAVQLERFQSAVSLIKAIGGGYNDSSY